MSNGTLNFSYLRYEDEQKAGVVIEGDHIFISRYEPTIGKSRNRTKNWKSKVIDAFAFKHLLCMRYHKNVYENEKRTKNICPQKISDYRMTQKLWTRFWDTQFINGDHRGWRCPTSHLNGPNRTDMVFFVQIFEPTRELEPNGGDKNLTAEEHESGDDEKLEVGKNFHFDDGHAWYRDGWDWGEEKVEVTWGGGGSSVGEL